MPMPPTAAAAAVGSTEGDPIDLVADEPAADAAPSSTDEHMYVAIFPFAGENEGDLSFSENTILQVLDYCEGEAWWVCRRVNEGDPNEEGYVPSNYLTPMKAPGDATSGDMGLTEAEAAT